jgi:predicted nucleic acid-binding protein
MGALTLPTSGAVYLDTDAIIYSVEKIAPYWAILEPLWSAAQSGLFVVIASELTLMEPLVRPIQIGDAALEKTFRMLLTATREVQLMPVSRSILEQAARLRAATGLKTPDAIHATTARAEHVALFVTNDPGFKRVPGLPLALLDDVDAS